MKHTVNSYYWQISTENIFKQKVFENNGLWRILKVTSNFLVSFAKKTI
jgi:hypothetical protein